MNIKISYILTIFSLIFFPLCGYSTLQKKLTRNDTIQLFEKEMNSDMEDVQNFQSRMVLAVFKKDRGDGELCVMNAAGRPELVPSFMATAHLDKSFEIDGLLSEYRICDSHEVSEIEYVARNAVEGPVHIVSRGECVGSIGFGCSLAGGVAVTGSIVFGVDLPQFTFVLLGAGFFGSIYAAIVDR